MSPVCHDSRLHRPARQGACPPVDNREQDVLRELARRVSEIAFDPLQEERRQRWSRINRLEHCRIPLLLVMNDLYWNEVVPTGTLVTTDPVARRYERKLRLQIWQWENIADDCVTEPVVEYFTHVRMPRLIAADRLRPGCQGLGAYHVMPVIEGGAGIDTIVVDPHCSVDWERTAQGREWVETVFDGILKPVRRTPWLGCAPFDYLCEIRGMDNLFMDMIERPEWVEEAMQRLHQVHIDAARALERENALDLNNAHQLSSNGGQSYTDQLPAPGFDPGHVRLKDMWGHSTAQAAVSISPEMHERFITQFEREYHRLFGLTGVGCCETIDRKMHLYRALPNLRRISVCAWNDFGGAAAGIGRDYIYSVKPAAAAISQPGWDVSRDMAELEHILEQARGCHIEVIHREVATCNGQPERLVQWFKAAKSLVMKYSCAWRCHD